MGNFKYNPKKPFEVKVPNKIRKRIFMHEKDAVALGKVEALLMPLVVATKKRGSMWSRFTDRVKNLLGG